jgi:hypothetical protein
MSSHLTPPAPLPPPALPPCSPLPLLLPLLLPLPPLPPLAPSAAPCYSPAVVAAQRRGMLRKKEKKGCKALARGGKRLCFLAVENGQKERCSHRVITFPGTFNTQPSRSITEFITT